MPNSSKLSLSSQIVLSQGYVGKMHRISKRQQAMQVLQMLKEDAIKFLGSCPVSITASANRKEMFDRDDPDPDSLDSISSCDYTRAMAWSQKQTDVEKPLKSLIQLASGDEVPLCSGSHCSSYINDMCSKFVAMRCGKLVCAVHTIDSLTTSLC
jgi:hypothetical protein